MADRDVEEDGRMKATFRNAAYLRTQQYRDVSNLDARVSLHARFSTNPVEWQRWLFEHMDLMPWNRILELGCGQGAFWQRNADRLPPGCRVTLTDLSAGMVKHARQSCADPFVRFQFALVDAQALPFNDGYFDVVIANHMLYHVPDLDRALSEIRRVLRPEGRLCAATNGANHMRELRTWSKRFGLGFSYGVAPHMHGFDLEHGAERLDPWFDDVTMVRYEDELIVTEVEPLMAYILSTPGGNDLADDQVVRCREFFLRMIEERGSIHITKDAGVFCGVRRDEGGNTP